jgi:uncharacterized repeat protein (TIGR03803 family)
MLGLGLAWVQPAEAQFTFQRLKSFGIPAQSGANPFANVIQGSDGALYGTTGYGSPSAIEGTVFKLNTNGSGFTVLHPFTGLGGDGENPGAALVQGSDGMLYGTTGSGGTYDAGTVFKLNTDGSGYKVLFSFGDGTTGYPAGALVQGSDGTLYGTAAGYSSGGTVFKLSTNGSGFMVLHTFTGTSGDGERPFAALLLGSDGALYGTTEDGGSGGGGTVFTLQTNGSGYMVLHPFTGDNDDGASPVAALIQGNDGALYGTTEDGGSNSLGVVFKLNTDGSGYTNLYCFTYFYEYIQGVGEEIVYPDGLYPEAALVQGNDGELYGTTAGNNANNENGAGTVFKLNTDGSDFTTVYSFTSPGNIDSYGTNVDGETPVASLIQLADGAFYGTAAFGGNSYGTVFKVNGDGSGFTTLHAFSNTGGDGINPTAALVQGGDGTLYGSTTEGGSVGYIGAGTVFKLNPDGSGYTILLNLPVGPFTGTTAGNSVNVILGNDGVLYGTTEFNGGIYQDMIYDGGEVFKVNPDGSGFMVLYTFQTPYGDGAQPVAPLMQASDGALYGTTEHGGIYDAGTVFKLNTNGSGYQMIYDFSVAPETSGEFPAAALVQGSDGMLYGTTTLNGTNGSGTAFKLATDGSGFTVIHSFGAGTDGEEPQAALVQGKDGFLYGTTPYGGTNQEGMIFKLSTDGSVYTDIYDFLAYPDTSGASPTAPLVQGNDGALYGTASGSGGGGYGVGTVFKLNTDGSGFTVLYTFLDTAYANGSEPEAALLQGKNGSFYGTTESGGDLGFGTIFALQGPTLYISQSGGTVTVFWQDVSGWTLQQNNSLTMPAGWLAGSGVTTSNGTNYLNITLPASNMFYRLSHP